MRVFVNCMLIAATIALGGCATAAHRQAQTIEAGPRFAGDIVRVCETALYRASSDDVPAALNCANVLDVWQ